MADLHAVAVDGGQVVAGGDQPVAPWWSFGKTVIAAAALSLVAQGRLALDQPVDGAPYTLRQLLQHRSGLAEYGGLEAYHQAVARGDAPWSTARLLEALDAGRLRYPPGEGWMYSNVGYLKVREQIEAVTGQDLGAALSTLVFQPLGIDGASVAREPADLAGVSMGSAQGYHPGWVYHGLVVGPLGQAALLLDRLMAGRLLPPGLLGEMQTAWPLPQFADGLFTAPGYGLGLMMPFSDAVRAAGHTGGGPGSSLAVYRFAQRSPVRTVAVFAIADDPRVAETAAFDLA